MSSPLVILLGKAVRAAAKFRGGGSAFPGLFVEKINKDFIAETLSQLPDGVVLVSGTNGKTTTTKMVVELLEGQGKKVFTNRTGSNFTRGVAAALLGDIDLSGTLNADIAVLELDEAYAVHFVATVKPRHTLLLNVMRDQLDRFGEIDATAKLLQTVAAATQETIVINREDPRLVDVARDLPAKKLRYFGLDPSLHSLFPSDDDMRGPRIEKRKSPVAISVLNSVDNHRIEFLLGTQHFSATLKLEGIYNVFNAIAAVAVVSSVLGRDLNSDTLIKSLEAVTPAFGRGEKILVGGQPVELVLVKNPGGFRLGLSSYDPAGYATMIAVNDNYADGRDMSWLWDVEFDSLKQRGVSHVSGVRAFDMALRLQYDEVEIVSVDTRLPQALRSFIAANPDTPKRIYCTYTAMLTLRQELSKITKVSAWS